MQQPNIETDFFIQEREVTVKIIAYRKVTRQEACLALNVYLRNKKKLPKAGGVLKIFTTLQ